jgi:pimeloyl-ACP methyl ester carboxylesterase
MRSLDDRCTRERVALNIRGVDVDLAVLHRPGPRLPIVFLHGFGSTKEDYADAALAPEFEDHEIIAWDAPGFGASGSDDLGATSIPFLVDTALAVLGRFDIDRFHLVGHSMGGLTGLLLADGCPKRVATFSDIEGNLAPEDCFLSRQIRTHPEEDPRLFLERFADRVASSGAWASALYAAGLARKVRPDVVRSVFESMVDLSDDGDLLRRFVDLPFPRQFMHGDQNRHLSYLPGLRAAGVDVAEIERCGHFPMYSNPPQMWAALARLQARAYVDARRPNG